MKTQSKTIKGSFVVGCRHSDTMTKEDKKIFAKYAKEIEVLSKRLGY